MERLDLDTVDTIAAVPQNERRNDHLHEFVFGKNF